MILRKKFYCTFEDTDAVIIALAKELEDGWHISSIENHGLTMCCSRRREEAEFSIELERKERIGTNG